METNERNILQPKPFRWMLDIIWLNLVELSHLEPFSDLLEMVSGFFASRLRVHV